MTSGRMMAWDGSAWVPVAVDDLGRVLTDLPAGGGDAPDIIWAEPVVMRDTLAPRLVQPDIVRYADAHRETLGMPDPLRLSDQRIVPLTSAVYPELFRFPEAAEGRASDIYIPRSGTPDSDWYGDGWVDGIPLNNGVNHGNESPLTVGANTIITTQKDAFFKYDLRRFANLVAPAGSTMTLHLYMAQNAAVLQSVSLIFSNKGATNPFTESTLTWNNRPTDGTSPVTKVIDVSVITLGNPPLPFTATLTAAEYGPFLGSWMLVRATSAALATFLISISSREAAVVAERPLLSFGLRRN